MGVNERGGGESLEEEDTRDLEPQRGLWFKGKVYGMTEGQPAIASGTDTSETRGQTVLV